MKTLSILVFCLVAGTCWAEPPPAVKEILDGRAKKCQESVGASEDDLKEVLSHKAESDGAKKVLVCVAKESKLLVDGKFSVEGSLELASEILAAGGVADADKQLEGAKEVSEKCATDLSEKKADTDEEMTVNIFECLRKGATEKGLFLDGV